MIDLFDHTISSSSCRDPSVRSRAPKYRTDVIQVFQFQVLTVLLRSIRKLIHCLWSNAAPHAIQLISKFRVTDTMQCLHLCQISNSYSRDFSGRLVNAHADHTLLVDWISTFKDHLGTVIQQSHPDPFSDFSQGDVENVKLWAWG